MRNSSRSQEPEATRKPNDKAARNSSPEVLTIKKQIRLLGEIEGAVVLNPTPKRPYYMVFIGEDADA